MQSHLQKISSVYRVSYASSVQLGNNNKIEILGKVKKLLGSRHPSLAQSFVQSDVFCCV
jgi:hypothetical protein